MNVGSRPRIAVYWASGCGGCEATFLDLGERLLELEDSFEIVFFPLLVDAKYDDLDALADGGIDVVLVSGAIRNAHDLAMTRRLRELASTMVALGTCAHLGSVLGLANLDSREALLAAVFGSAEAAPTGGLAACGEQLALPQLEASLRPLEAAVTIDYTIPGCPPERETLWQALGVLASAEAGFGDAPPPGTALGASSVALCEECPREPPRGPAPQLRRTYEVVPEPDACLLDQGLLCVGPATRGGCGAVCIAAGIGCRGCYGPLDGIVDQGARMLGALTAIAGPKSFDEVEAGEEADALVESVPDLVGSLYRYSFARSLLGTVADRGKEGPCDE